MEPPTPKQLFLESLNRCVIHEGFIPAFYARFLLSSEEVREKFRQTDFARQNAMLLRSLTLVAGATSGEGPSLQELWERAETHDRHHLNIEPHLYSIWVDAAIATARDFDGEWDGEVEAAWRRILGYVTHHMIKHY